MTIDQAFSPLTSLPESDPLKVGFRLGSKGTHSSRTLMFEEISHLFEATELNAKRPAYSSAIVDENCLAKRTASSRRLTNQRLGELYGLDPAIPIFRAFRRLWSIDPNGRQLLAILIAMARDPLLAVTAPVVTSLEPGAELQRDSLLKALRLLVVTRMNDRVLEKVCRNVASSWTQSGHLSGRTRKRRRRVTSTPCDAAFAIYLAYASGCRGSGVFNSIWFQVLDCTPAAGQHLALEAKRLGLIDLRVSGDVVDLNLARFDPGLARG